MKTSTYKKSFQFYLWVGLVWIGLWLFSYLLNYPDTFGVRLVNELWRTAYLIAVNLIYFEFAWPFITRKRKYLIANIGIGIFMTWLAFMFLSYGLYAWRQFGITLGIYTSLRQYDTLDHSVAFQAQAGIMSLFFFGVIKHVSDYRKLQIATQQLRIEKQQAELNYLKSQTNPHFLFNTLNNIYSLARDKSDLAPESILRLSKILRFMLYEAGGEYITVEQELKIITDYIALEQLRYDENLRVNLNHSVDDVRQSIPPLLLIPLVENAFKHGVSETRGDPFIDIHLSIKMKELLFVVKNSAETVAETQNSRENIGLSNLRRQLELLYKDYSLTVRQDDSVFTANLKINLASHV